MRRPLLNPHALLALLVLLCGGLPAGKASAQVDALRQKDDQFIQALRDQGMSDLLDRFVEVDAPEEPIARRTLEVAQSQFAADNALERAIEQFQAGNPEAGQQLFEQSRASFETALKSQREMIEENPQDERVPIWQTDLAQMLIFSYLPVYHQKAPWYYEFGMPSPEQTEAFEDSVVLALEMLDDATRRLDLLTDRVGADPGLRTTLEELGIWYKVQDQYAKVATPFCYGFACHYVALLPDDHRYFKTLGSNPRVTNQAADPTAEKKRLRVLSQLTLGGGGLTDRDDTGLMAKLIAGSSMVRMGGRDNAARATAEYLEDVSRGNNPELVYVAALAMAVGKKQENDLQTAVERLEGVIALDSTIPYVNADGTHHSRLIAADLMHRLLMEPAEKAQGDQKTELVSVAYTRPYLPLIKLSPTFATLLYDRWASMVEPGQDPTSLPELVRMGVGERLSQRGVSAAIETSNIASADGVAVAQQSDAYKLMYDLFEQADVYHETLAGEETEDGVRARALFNRGKNQVIIYQIENQVKEGRITADLILPITETFATIVLELSETEQAELASQEGLVYTQWLDNRLNVVSGRIQNAELRERYVAVTEKTFEKWPRTKVANDQRLYIGIRVYEPLDEFEKAVEAYRGCPVDHRDYFSCRTQMMWVLRRQYRAMYNEVELMGNNPPADDAPDAQKQTYERQLAEMREDMDRVRRELLDDANHLRAVAENEIDSPAEPARRFSAVLARGAAKVVGGQMLGDTGKVVDALAVLENFEQDFDPEGELKQLIEAQRNPDNARENLDGVIRSAMESRILALVRGGQEQNAVPEARKMMDNFPDAGRFVISAVLGELEDEITRLQQSQADERVQATRDQQQGKIEARAAVAVAMGEMVVEWAKNQGLQGAQLMRFERDLAQSQMIAGNPEEAARIIRPWVEEFDKDPLLALLAGRIFFAQAQAKANPQPGDYEPARQQYGKIILAYNNVAQKPPVYWQARYYDMLVLDAVGGDKAKEIPGLILKLQNFDPRLGGDLFDEFEALRIKHLAQG